jgi:hypothetical protein
LLRPHGGYLILSLDDAVTEPAVWKVLKRTLRSDRIEMEMYEPYIYPVRSIDEGLAILTGAPADSPEGGAAKVNDAVRQRLKELAMGLKEFVAAERNGAVESKP